MSQQINLYNAAFKPKRELLTAQSLAISTLVLLVLVGGTATWARLDAKGRAEEQAAAQIAQKAAQDKLEAARTAAGMRKPSAALQAEIAEKKALLTMRDEVLAALQDGMGDPAKGGAGFSEYLRGLGRQSVSGLWLTGFAVSAGGTDMSLRGRALDKSLLPDYVRRLNAEKAFAGKSFAGLRMDAKQEGATTTPGAVKTTASPAVPPPPTSAAARTSPAAWMEFQLTATAAPEEAKR
jgi:hypothetical protein